MKESKWISCSQQGAFKARRAALREKHSYFLELRWGFSLLCNLKYGISVWIQKDNAHNYKVDQWAFSYFMVAMTHTLNAVKFGPANVLAFELPRIVDALFMESVCCPGERLLSWGAFVVHRKGRVYKVWSVQWSLQSYESGAVAGDSIKASLAQTIRRTATNSSIFCSHSLKRLCVQERIAKDINPRTMPTPKLFLCLFLSSTLGLVCIYVEGAHAESLPRKKLFHTIGRDPNRPGVTTGWNCVCNEDLVRVATKAECLSKPDKCWIGQWGRSSSTQPRAEHWCSCMKRKVGNQIQCCKCESRKCKCWHSWWKDRRYKTHASFKKCNQVCRRRECSWILQLGVYTSEANS